MNASEQVLKWLDQHNVNLTTVSITVGLLAAAFGAMILINRMLRSWLRLLETRISLPHETVLTITRVISSLLWLITALIILDIWGVGLGGIWTLLVSVATVVGVGFLATWTIVSNVTASFFISVWRPFYIGDVVQVMPENLKGRVIDRNLMYTALRDDDGSVIQVPNNLFFQKMFRVIDRNDRLQFDELGRRRAERAPPTAG
jgi:small-conductance mechanosensitive channel